MNDDEGSPAVVVNEPALDALATSDTNCCLLPPPMAEASDCMFLLSEFPKVQTEVGQTFKYDETVTREVVFSGGCSLAQA